MSRTGHPRPSGCFWGTFQPVDGAAPYEKLTAGSLDRSVSHIPKPRFAKMRASRRDRASWGTPVHHSEETLEPDGDTGAVPDSAKITGWLLFWLPRLPKWRFAFEITGFGRICTGRPLNSPISFVLSFTL